MRRVIDVRNNELKKVMEQLKGTHTRLYVVGMMYIDSQIFEPEAITGTQEKARQWINEKMEGYQYNGIGYYTIREIPYVG